MPQSTETTKRNTDRFRRNARMQAKISLAFLIQAH